MPFPNSDTQFRPGESGNPAGRPKGQSVTARLRTLLDETSIGGKTLPGGKTVRDIVCETIVKQVLAGDFRFAELLLNRADGLMRSDEPGNATPSTIDPDVAARIREAYQSMKFTTASARPSETDDLETAPNSGTG